MKSTKNADYQRLLLLLTACALLALLLVFTGQGGGEHGQNKTALFVERGLRIDVEVANTTQSIRSGLMNRTGLSEKTGMLFDLGSEQRQTFWMYRTLIPLDIIFMNERMEIVDIQTMTPCGRPDPDGCEHYTSRTVARYALEVNAGFVKKNGIEIGQRLELE